MLISNFYHEICLLHDSPCSRLNIYWTRAHPTGSWKSQVIFFLCDSPIFCIFSPFLAFLAPMPKMFCNNDNFMWPLQRQGIASACSKCTRFVRREKKIRSWLSRPTKTTAGCVDGMGTSLFKLARHRKQYSSLLQKTPRFEVRYISVVCCIYTRLLFSL